jgi:ankyrin repeat protein
MFCPQCRVEYREGFTECSDCRVPLVAKLSAQTETPAVVDMVEVLVTEDPAFLDEAMTLLREAEIGCSLESGRSVIPDGLEIDLEAGAVTLTVSTHDEPAAQECLRELVERYSLSEEDLESLQNAQKEQIDAFLTGEPGALVGAAEAGSSAAVEKLLADGADVNQKNDAGQTALIVAVDGGDEGMINDLLAAGADVNAADADGIRALHFAAHKGRASIVELLLSQGAEVDAQHSDGLSALMLAAENGHLDCAQLLMAKGADVSLRDGGGNSPTSLAEHMGYTRLVRLFAFKVGRDAGTAADVADTEGRDELLLAAAKGEVDLLSALIDVGADLGATDTQGRTALMWATLEGQAEAAEALISHGAEVDAKDPDGGTALSWASDRGHIDVVRVLVKHGADPDLKDAQGWTPQMWAEDKGQHEIATVLRAASEGKLG